MVWFVTGVYTNKNSDFTGRHALSIFRVAITCKHHWTLLKDNPHTHQKKKQAWHIHLVKSNAYLDQAASTSFCRFLRPKPSAPFIGQLSVPVASLVCLNRSWWKRWAPILAPSIVRKQSCFPATSVRVPSNFHWRNCHPWGRPSKNAMQI